MLKKARFKGFKIKRKGKWFQLYGSVNPWVLLASGKIEEVETKGGVNVGQQGKFTLKGSDETVDGILVGINKAGSSSKSKFVKSLDDGTTNVDEFLKIADDSARKKIINGVNNFDYAATVKAHGKEVADVMKNRGQQLAKNIGKEGAGEFDQAHHLIPVDLIKRSDLVRKAINGGFKFNGKTNGKWLKQFSSKVDELKDGLHASPPSGASIRLCFLIDPDASIQARVLFPPLDIGSSPAQA